MEKTIKKIDVVGAVIYDELQDKYMATQRDLNRHMGGMWEFPGGKIESGENEKEALIREIKEELDCTIGVLGLIEDYTHSYPDITVRLITYLCSIEEGVPTLTEHENLKWVNREEMKCLQWAEADIPTVNKLLSLAAGTFCSDKS